MSAQLPSASTSDDRDLLFFRDVVRNYTDDKRHLKRTWLCDVVWEKVRQQNTRYVVLIGAPGSGKSSLIAELASEDPRSLVYLLRRDQRTALAEGSAKAFLVRVGFQFLSVHPDVFETDDIRLEVTQSITTTSSAGDVTGARIARLLASPFYQTVVRVQQQVGNVGGRLTGLDINEIVSDPQLLSVSDLEALALRTPARILMKRRPAEHVIILVDALDELGPSHNNGRTPYAPGQDVDLVSWLHDQSQLPENIRFVLTSRPGEALDAFLEKQAPFVSRIQLDPSAEQIRNEVAVYTQMLASEMRADELLVDDEAERRFADQANEKAAGSLGYVGALGRALDHALAKPDRQTALAPLLHLEQLPQTIEELYAFFFHQIKAQLAGQVVEIGAQWTSSPGFAPSWPAVYRKALAVLCVAHEPLTVDQIADLGQIATDRSYVDSALQNLEQFLRRDSDGARVSFYHPTVAEFLTDTGTRDDSTHADLFIDRVAWNARIAALLGARFVSAPDALDDYAIRYRILHQIAGDSPDSAHAAMTSAWMLFKRARTGDDRSFHTDLMQVVQSFRERTTRDISALVRCCLVDAVLLARIRVLPPDVAAIWAIRGQGTRANSLISLISSPGKRAEAFLELAKGLGMIGATDSARDALRSAAIAAKLNPYYGDRLATLGAVLSAAAVDTELASLALKVVGETVAEAGKKEGDELSWYHESAATVYERACPFLPRELVSESQARLHAILEQPGGDLFRGSILLSAARVSDVLDDPSAAASFAERALAEADRPPAVAGIESLCASAYRLGQLKDQTWTAKSLERAFERLQEGLDAAGEAYAIALIAKSGLDTLPGFDISRVDIGRAFELARVTRDARVFRLLTEVFAAQGDLKRATAAAEMCYVCARLSHSRQDRFTSVVSTDVIVAFRASRDRSGLLRLLDDCAKFGSPGWEWERDHIVDIVSDAAVHVQFEDVLERALAVATDTRNIWERASALSRVGKAYAILGEKQRAGSILELIEGTVAAGLQVQFPHKRVRGALLLAAATMDAAQPGDGAPDKDSLDPRYLAVARALGHRPAGVEAEESSSLTSAVEALAQWAVAEYPLYTLLKTVAAENDIEALAAVQRWEEQTANDGTRWTIRDLRTLATSSDPQQLVTAARSVMDSFERLGVIPGAALAVVDALVTAGMPDEASRIVEGLSSSAQRARANAIEQVSWEAAAYLTHQRLRGVIGSQESLIALLDHARDVDMLSTARTVADTAPAIMALVGTQSVGRLVSVVDEVAALE